MAVCAAWEDITEDVVCASLCVEAPEKAFWEWCKIFSTFVEFPKALQRPASPKHSWRRGGMGDVRCDAFAPRISFVRCPRKWDKNANWEITRVLVVQSIRPRRRRVPTRRAKTWMGDR